jgi:D-sedoheptulose 7-phosphate isomerase
MKIRLDKDPMDSKKRISDYITKLKAALDHVSIEDISRLYAVLRDAYVKDRTVFIIGNGGSGATAAHLACDYNKGICAQSPKKLRVISLADNMPVILAIANDLSYDRVFVEQLKNHLRPGDVVMGISGSGNSRNVIEAIRFANEAGSETIGLCGYDGGQLKKICRHSVHVNVNDMQIVEDVHLAVGHILMQILDAELSLL